MTTHRYYDCSLLIISMIGRDYSKFGIAKGVEFHLEVEPETQYVCTFFQNAKNVILISEKHHSVTSHNTTINHIHSEGDDDHDTHFSKKFSHHINRLRPDGSTEYFDIVAVTGCVVDGETVAIADKKDNIKIINVPEWRLDAVLGRHGSASGHFNAITSICCLSILSDKYFFTCESSYNRIQVVSADNEPIAHTGKIGHGRGQFKFPASITCYLPEKYSRDDLLR